MSGISLLIWTTALHQSQIEKVQAPPPPEDFYYPKWMTTPFKKIGWWQKKTQKEIAEGNLLLAMTFWLSFLAFRIWSSFWHLLLKVLQLRWWGWQGNNNSKNLISKIGINYWIRSLTDMLEKIRHVHRLSHLNLWTEGGRRRLIIGQPLTHQLRYRGLHCGCPSRD